MFWLPVVFIVIELIYFVYIPVFFTHNAYSELKKRNEKKNFLTKEEVKELPDLSKNKFFVFCTFIFIIYLLMSFVYYVFAIFEPFWYFAIVYLFIMLISEVWSKIFPSKTNYDSFLDIDKISNIQLQRKIKLTTLDSKHKMNKIKILLKAYFFSFVRLSIPLAIIIMHYHYNMF